MSKFIKSVTLEKTGNVLISTEFGIFSLSVDWTEEEKEVKTVKNTVKTIEYVEPIERVLAGS